MKSLPTVLASERFHSGVYANVRVQGRTPVESFSASRAHVRLLFGMDDFMSAQSGCLSETFAAYFAYKWSRSGMHRHVPGQIVVRVESLSAILTLVDFRLDEGLFVIMFSARLLRQRSRRRRLGRFHHGQAYRELVHIFFSLVRRLVVGVLRRIKIEHVEI